MGIDPEGWTADLLLIRACSHREDLISVFFDGSTPLRATKERRTFTPVPPFGNANDHPGGARAAIFTVTDKQTGAESPPARGADHVFGDGLLPETVNLEHERGGR